MKRSLPLCLSLGLLAAVYSPCPSAAQDAAATGTDPSTFDAPLGLTPDQASAFIGQLTEVQEAFAATKKEITASALSRLSTAAGSESAAAELYLAAWKIINIDRRPVIPGAEPPKAEDTEWRDQLVAWMTETGAPKALRVQLAWMALSIEAAQKLNAGEDIKTLYPRARELAQQAVSVLRASSGVEAPDSKVVATVRSRDEGDEDRRRRGGPSEADRAAKELRNILSQPSMSSIFAQAYNLHNFVQAPKDFARAPLDLTTLYNVMLLPYYRAEKKENLAELWDEWIGYTAADKQASLDEAGFIMWGATGGKDLQWQKNLDLLKHGVNAPACAAELIRMVKENPNHPSLGSWVSDLEQVMSLVMGG